MKLHCATALDSAAAAAALTRAERDFLDRLAGTTRRADWRAGRLAAKRAVAAALGRAALDRIEIDSPGDRPPRALLRHRPLDLTLSLAHDDARAVAAVARGGRVGVDLERECAVPGEQARYFLSSRERGAAGLSTLACWTLKEAAWKALGLTRADPFTSLELVWQGTEVVAVAHAGVRRAARAVLSRPWHGYLAAVVVVPEAM